MKREDTNKGKVLPQDVVQQSFLIDPGAPGVDAKIQILLSKNIFSIKKDIFLD